MYISWLRHQMETIYALLAFVRGIHRSPVNSPHKGQWRGALMFSFICTWMNGWVNNREAGDLRRHRAHHDVIVLLYSFCSRPINEQNKLFEMYTTRIERWIMCIWNKKYLNITWDTLAVGLKFNLCPRFLTFTASKMLLVWFTLPIKCIGSSEIRR